MIPSALPHRKFADASQFSVCGFVPSVAASCSALFQALSSIHDSMKSESDPLVLAAVETAPMKLGALVED